MGKIGLAVTPANPNLVYATIEADQKEKGFYQPTLNYALRNSKEIIDFDSKYSDTVKSSKMTKEIIRDNRILPRESWPFCGLKPINPTNQTHGPKPILKNHEESQSLFEVIKKCCDYFPPV